MESELQPRVGLAVGVGVRWGWGCGCCGDRHTWGAGGAWERAVLGTCPRSPSLNHFALLVPLREKKTKPKPLRVNGRKGESNFAERDAQRCTGQAGWGRAGSEGGVREPGGLGTSGASVPGRGWGQGRGHCLVPEPTIGPERPQKACARSRDRGRGLWERLKGTS